MSLITVEVCFKVGRSNPSNFDPQKNFEDGAVLQVIPVQAAHVPAAELAAWELDNDGAIPPAISAMAEAKREALYGRFKELFALLVPGLDRGAAIQALGMRPNAAGQAELDRRISQAFADRNHFLTYGLDLNWGMKVLQIHGVVRMDMTPEEIEDATYIPSDTTGHPLAPPARRASTNKVVLYRDFLTAEQVALLEDPNEVLAVDRVSSPILYASYNADHPRAPLVNPPV